MQALEHQALKKANIHNERMTIRLAIGLSGRDAFAHAREVGNTERFAAPVEVDSSIGGRCR